MIEDFWHALLTRGLAVLQKINNLHREYGLWQLADHWKAALCAFLLFVAAAFGAGHLYGKLAHQRLLTNATEALERKDMRGAAVFAMKLLRDDPNDIAACKVMVKATDENWPQDALYWHGRLEKLEPGDTGNYLAWARTALGLGNGPLAVKILAKVRPADTNGAEYEWLAGEAAFSQQKLDESAAHLEKAAALDPANVEYAFDLARVRLLLPGDAAKPGRQELESLLGDPKLRVESLRLLLRDAMSHRQAPRAFTYFDQLKKEPSITFQDRMQFLDFLLRLHHPGLMSEVRDYQKSAQTPESVSSLAFWMNVNDMALVAVEWVITLPPALRESNKVQLALAESYVALEDWPRLRPLVTDKDWKDLDFLRVALRARCFAEQGAVQQFQNEWNLAVLKASDNPKTLAQLCETAISWGSHWDTEAEDLSWKILDEPNPPMAIMDAMQVRFITQGETGKLHRLLKRRLELDPSNRSVQNNFALVSLLLRKNEEEARVLAQKAYEAAPSDARSGSTYALSLYLQGQRAEALNVMSHFGTQLKIPSVAVYNGIFLAACGEPGPAREYLALAKQTQLLPEEEKLAAAAEAAIGDATPAPVTTGTVR